MGKGASLTSRPYRLSPLSLSLCPPPLSLSLSPSLTSRPQPWERAPLVPAAPTRTPPCPRPRPSTAAGGRERPGGGSGQGEGGEVRVGRCLMQPQKSRPPILQYPHPYTLSIKAHTPATTNTFHPCKQPPPLQHPPFSTPSAPTWLYARMTRSSSGPAPARVSCSRRARLFARLARARQPHCRGGIWVAGMGDMGSG